MMLLRLTQKLCQRRDVQTAESTSGQARCDLLEQPGVAIRVAERSKGKVAAVTGRSEEHTSELQSPCNLVCRLLLEKKNNYSDLLNCRSVVRVIPKIWMTWYRLCPLTLCRYYVRCYGRVMGAA